VKRSNGEGPPPAGEPRLTGLYPRLGKPLLDRLFGLIAGLVTLPAFLPLLLVSWAAFGAAPIVRTPSMGKDGRSFDLYRLRTTRRGEEDGTGSRQRLGSFLRQWSLDELPQIWNVITGDMSLIGPRPLGADEADNLQDWQRERHRVRPGITGLWQVEARGDGRRLLDNIHYDIQYIDQISLVTDLRILLKTLSSVAARSGNWQSRTKRIRVRFPHIRLVTVDLLAWAAALTIADVARMDFRWSLVSQQRLFQAFLIVATGQLAWGFAVGLYRGRFRLASYEEITWVAFGSALGAVLLFVATAILPGTNLLPRGAILAGAAYHLLAALAARYIARAVYAAEGYSPHHRKSRLLILGAGEAGTDAAMAIWKDPTADVLPVAFLDDDHRKARLRPHGLPVVGGRNEIARAAKRYNADTLLIAAPSAPQQAITEIAGLAQDAGLRVRILPRLAKFVIDPDAAVLASDIREITLADFLRRDEINLDLLEIAGYLAGKKVLITGAGGSIGSVLCRIVEGFNPKKLYKLDHDENALYRLELDMEGRALLDTNGLILCDIRDRERMHEVMQDIKPDVVFHAAAHKHVAFLERHPAEAVKTNVFGTLNVLEAAARAGVERFVNISTDKAAEPANVLGLTKRIGEMLTADFAARYPGTFMSVRFGNVLGSAGSAIPTFRQQIESNQPITITDPDVTRFFMTIEEACQLVVQSGAVGGSGNVHVLDMGEPIKIVDIARQLQRQLRPDAEPDFIYTGLRPGEKLHEVLAGPDEEFLDRPHKLLLRYAVVPLDQSRLADLADHPTLEAMLACVQGTDARTG